MNYTLNNGRELENGLFIQTVFLHSTSSSPRASRTQPLHFIGWINKTGIYKVLYPPRTFFLVFQEERYGKSKKVIFLMAVPLRPYTLRAPPPSSLMAVDFFNKLKKKRPKSSFFLKGEFTYYNPRIPSLVLQK